MAKNYNIDDILAEVKRKKQDRTDSAPAVREYQPTPNPMPLREEKTPRAAKKPVEQEPPPKEQRAPVAEQEPPREASRRPQFKVEIPSRQEGAGLSAKWRADMDDFAPQEEEPRKKRGLFGKRPQAEEPKQRHSADDAYDNYDNYGDYNQATEEAAPAPIPYSRSDDDYPALRRQKIEQQQEEDAPYRAAPEAGVKLAPESFAQHKQQPVGDSLFDFAEELDDDEGFDKTATRFDLPVLRAQGNSEMHRHRDFAIDPKAFDGGGVGANLYEGDLDDDDDDQDDDEGYSDEMLEYRSPKDARAVWRELAGLKTGLLVRMGISLLCSIMLIYLALSYTYAIPLPGFMLPETNLTMFFIVNVAFVVLAVIACSNTIGGGILSLVTLKADNDSLVSIAALISLVQGTALIISPEQFATPGVGMFLPLVAIMLFFNSFGKLLIANRLVRSFGLLSQGDNARLGVAMMDNKDVAREITRGQNLDVPKVAYEVKADFYTSFLELSYSEDYSDSVSRILAPITLGAGLMVALISFFITKDIYIALTVLAACACISSPLTALFVGNLPMAILSRRMAQEKSMVSGYAAVEKFSETNTMVLGCADIFPTNSIVLHGIKVFQKNRIDEAILDAASVICSCQSNLKPIFTQMIGGRESILKNVESLTYEDGLGLSAWVDGKRVLIGSRDLMLHHGIDTPSRDYEEKFRQNKRELLYLSNSGELTAMYVVSYEALPDVQEQLDMLADYEISLAIYSTDPNITPEKLEEIFDYPKDLIKIIPSKVHGSYDQMAAPRSDLKAHITTNGTLENFVHTLLECRLCKSSILFGSILQMVLTIIGFALITFFAFMQNTGAITWYLIFGYQIAGTLIVFLLPNLRRI